MAAGASPPPLVNRLPVAIHTGLNYQEKVMAKAKASAPDTPARETTTAPETTQQQAGAGETQAKPETEPVIVALLVTAKVEGFCRAGRAWSKEQTRVEVADLSEEQVAALFGESMLDVVGVAE